MILMGVIYGSACVTLPKPTILKIKYVKSPQNSEAVIKTKRNYYENILKTGRRMSSVGARLDKNHGRIRGPRAQVQMPFT